VVEENNFRTILAIAYIRRDLKRLPLLDTAWKRKRKYMFDSEDGGNVFLRNVGTQLPIWKMAIRIYNVSSLDRPVRKLKLLPYNPIQSSPANYCWSSSAKAFLVWSSVGTHHYIFPSPSHFYCFEMEPALREDGLTTICWLPSMKEWLLALSRLPTRHFSLFLDTSTTRAHL
jgi:hypothetical protein